MISLFEAGIVEGGTDLEMLSQVWEPLNVQVKNKCVDILTEQMCGGDSQQLMKLDPVPT